SGPYGSKSFASIAPGKSTSASFTTRLAAVPSGSVTLTATGGGASPLTLSTGIPFTPASCG
ncbi:MAG TPA: hypothetical protein VFY91_16065, partial [Microbacterium sp.]|nr:hypothetical protein [Microbacterium sp.]